MDDNFYTKILLMSANPLSTSRLRLDEEMREIKEGLKRSKHRDKYIINTAEAVKYRDIHRAILDCEPQIIHFSGHGAGEEGLLFESEAGQTRLIDAAALAQLFQLFSEQVECVVLNACYSEYQAKEIARHINYVVGMSNTIEDRAALEFAVGFYDALGAGKGYKFAYQLGCSLIKIAGIPQELIPQLVTKDDLQAPCESESEVELPDTADDNFDTNVYINRPPVETKCYETILHTGALIRIKAPTKMGKTSLLENLLSYASEQGYATAKLDLKLAESSVLKDLQSFLQWLCADVSESLDMETKLSEHWEDIYGLNKNCTRYFQRYLLTNLENPLVLAIDNFELLFDYPDIFSEFSKLLRSWYEKAKQGDKIGNIWKKMRLLVVHSTDAYPTLDTNYSPFNVGLAIDLPEFNQSQVEAVARGYHLNGQVGEQGINELMQLVGGHPYLVQQAFSNLKNQLKNQQTTLKQLLQLAPTEQGIYANHLRQLLWNLQHNPLLKDAYKKVVMAKFPVPVDSEVSFKLQSLGLVKLSGNDCIPSCDLYRQYFCVRLIE